jgi:threonine aldolase
VNQIDLRSDTATHPTPAMREAMANAEVGNDVYGDDPTVNKLQDMAAEMTGKEAALFVPSGTMGNLAAILAHCQRGDEVILGKAAHTFLFEAGGISALGGIHSNQIPNQIDGSFNLGDVEEQIRPDDPHDPITSLIVIENTANRCGGNYQSVEYTKSLYNLAHKHNIKLHLDGARLFNATVAMKIKPKELTQYADSVTFCLSKGLCAPVGSVLCGDKEFIRKANRARKMLGGGMRQAGIIAAAGVVALETMIDRLAEDHIRAKNLAEGLSEIKGIELDGMPATNMVYFNLSNDVKLSVEQIENKLKNYDVLAHGTGNRRFRLVTHFWIDDKSVDKTVAAFEEVLKS